MNPQFDSLHTWVITDSVCSAMQSMISWWVIFFLSSFITFRTNVRMSIIPSPCLFLFVLQLEWSLDISADKKSNAICIFANLCSTLFRVWFKFSAAWFYFLSKYRKERGKQLTGNNLNVCRQFFKDVIHIFWCYPVSPNCRGVWAIPIPAKNCSPFAHFSIY